jgi:hypothetical protein
MKNKAMDEIADALAGDFPLAFKAAYPRNITTPGGYSDPRHYGASIVGNLINMQNPAMTQVSHLNGMMTSMMLMAHRVPTYFIADDFAFAAAYTNLPGDLKFSELLWPLPSQLFVLSDKFCQSYYDGIHAPYLAVSRMPGGIYPQSLRLPPLELRYPSVELTVDKIVVDYPICYENAASTDYNGNYPLSEGIDLFKDAPFTDSTPFESAMRGFDFVREDEVTPEQERVFIDKALMLAVKLILAVAARPAMVEHGKLMRQQTVHQGRVIQPSVTSPNIIGRNYVIQHRNAAGTRVVTSQRQAPKFRYRRGHWTWQAKRFKNIEFVAVDQMPRKPDPMQQDTTVIDFDAAGEALANKFRTCHERMWIEGWLFDETENDPKMPEKVAQ